MIDFLFNSIWGWAGIGGTIIAGALAVAYFFPPFRKLAIAVAAGAVAVLAIYSKGASDNARREKEKRDKAVNKAEKDYAEIDARPDKPDDVVDRLRSGRF